MGEKSRVEFPFHFETMPTVEEIQQRARDEKRVKEENARALAARKAVLKQRQGEITRNKADLDRQLRENAKELAGI